MATPSGSEEKYANTLPLPRNDLHLWSCLGEAVHFYFNCKGKHKQASSLNFVHSASCWHIHPSVFPSILSRCPTHMHSHALFKQHQYLHPEALCQQSIESLKAHSAATCRHSARDTHTMHAPTLRQAILLEDTVREKDKENVL